jgi:signal transduction histidine kinase
MRRHIERELVRARAGIRARVGAPQRIRTILDQVVAVLRRMPSGHSLEWEVAVPDDLAISVDAQDMAEIFGNLGENAVEWAASKIRIVARVADDAVVLSMEDDGPGVPEDQIGTVIARGGRLDEARSGTGLGLAIVRELAESYGGSLILRRSPLGGLEAELRFPLKAPRAGLMGLASDP